MNRVLIRMTWLFALGCIPGCYSKTPLDESYGAITRASGDWFANEGVAYIFFSLAEQPERLVNPVWEVAYNEQTKDGGVVEHPFTAIDLAQGVHEHQILPCGTHMWCGSYSFKSAGAIPGATIRFRYDKDSPLELTSDMSLANHAVGTTAASYSALVFGVFDEKNAALQARVHNNFAALSHEESLAYGLTRRFRISDAALKDKTIDEISALKKAADNPILFPATGCSGTSASAPLTFAGVSAWLPDEFPASTLAAGACLGVEYLDKQDEPLLLAKAYGYARRNPELSHAPLTLTSPRHEVNQIQVLVKICDDDPAAASMVDSQFFDYQKFILRMDRPYDVCFRLGQETLFEEQFKTHLQTRLSAAKSAGAPFGDYLFVVLLHENFGKDFNEIQSSMAGVLTTMVADEATHVSPRLVGGFVYDSSLNFQPTAEQKKRIIWCPQSLPTGYGNPALSLSVQNCTMTKAVALDLTLINFVAPLGPLPSQDAYKEYVKKYGDTGLAKNPSLHFYSPPTNENTRYDTNETVTFFDSERYVIGAGEGARVCSSGTDANYFRFRTATMGDTDASLDFSSVANLWLSKEAAGEYSIGLAWDYPFFGGINYDGALNGKIVSVVPYTRSVKSFETLGDPVWQTTSWHMSDYVQHCSRYCDNPYFEEDGSYQINSIWRTFEDYKCPNPSYPTP